MNCEWVTRRRKKEPLFSPSVRKRGELEGRPPLSDTLRDFFFLPFFHLRRGKKTGEKSFPWLEKKFDFSSNLERKKKKRKISGKSDLVAIRTISSAALAIFFITYVHAVEIDGWQWFSSLLRLNQPKWDELLSEITFSNFTCGAAVTKVIRVLFAALIRSDFY